MAKKSDDKASTEEEKQVKKAAPKKKAAAKKAPVKKAAVKKAPAKKAVKKAVTKKTTTKKETAKKDAPATTKSKSTPKAAPVKEEFTSEHFSSDMLTLEKQIHPNCRVKYVISPQKPLWDEAQKQAIKKVSKEISIPGFRKGKAPAAMILKKHPHGVKQETETSLANLSFQKAQELGQTPLLHGNNNVSFHLEGEEGDKKLIFTFESEPVIPAVDAKTFTIDKSDSEEIDETRVNEEIDNVRAFYANWNQISDRGAKEGDFLVLDIDDMDQDPPVQVFNGARFEFADGKMAPWMKDLVDGKKAGESIEGISKPDESASKEDKENFKEKKVLIKVISIEERSLPEIDDELAKKVGAEDLVQMKTNLTALTKSKDLRMKMQKYREEIEKQMIDNVIFEVPAALLEKEANHRMEQLLSNVEFKKKWEDEMDEEEKDFKKEEIKEKSKQAIRLFYLCRDIVAKNKISVSEEDMQIPMTNVLSMMYADQKVLQYQSMSDEQKQMALTQLMMQKAEDHLIEEILQG